MVGSGPAQNFSPVKGSELFINQVMQAPKMTNYEQLKRPKTNREDATRPGAIKYAQQKAN